MGSVWRAAAFTHQRYEAALCGGEGQVRERKQGCSPIAAAVNKRQRDERAQSLRGSNFYAPEVCGSSVIWWEVRHSSERIQRYIRVRGKRLGSWWKAAVFTHLRYEAAM